MPPDALLRSHHFEALGTTCAVFAVGAPNDRLLEAESQVRDLGARLTRFSSTSELSRLNASAGTWTAVSAELESVLRLALEAFEMSSGLVNIAVLPAVLATGYTRSFAEGPTVAVLESPQEVPRLPEVLKLRRGEACLRSGAGLDLGGIAKGLIADRLCQWIGPNALANIGGDLMATGGGPRGEGWPVAVGGVTLMLCDQGAATSSVRRRRWGELHHLIDPRTGAPARTGLEEVSVVASSGFGAEVVAKTALLLGPEFAPAYCAANALAWWLGGES